MKIKSLNPIRLANADDAKKTAAKTTEVGEIFDCSDSDGAMYIACGAAVELTAAEAALLSVQNANKQHADKGDKA